MPAGVARKLARCNVPHCVALKTARNPLRVLNNEDIHEMLGALGVFLAKLTQELMRSGIEAPHVAHDEWHELPLHDVATLSIFDRELTALLADSVLHQGVERQHALLNERADAYIDLGRRLPARRIN